MNVQKTLEIVARAVESKQAADLIILDVRKSSDVTDYILVCSGESGPQIRAIEKEIDAQLHKNKMKKIKWEGVLGSGWMILDLGPIVVHVMGTAERDYYRLEELWGKDAIVYHY